MIGPGTPTPGGPLTWRRETARDQAFLLALYAGTRTEELDRTGWPEEIRTAFVAQQFDAMTRGYSAAFPDADRWIIEQGGTPRAAVIVSRNDVEHRLVYIAVLSGARGGGLGTRILQQLQANAATAGLPLRLQALTDSPARRWYRRLGFVDTGANGIRVQLEWRSPG